MVEGSNPFVRFMDREELSHPLVEHFLHMLEFVKTVDPALFKRAAEFAQDQTGIAVDPDSFISEQN